MSKIASDFSSFLRKNVLKLYNTVGFGNEGGKTMGSRERVAALEQENRRLRAENETLLEVITQLRVTLNRLIDHYIVEK